MATSTYDDLISLAEQIRTNEDKNSNTAELVGATIRKIIEYYGGVVTVNDKQLYSWLTNLKANGGLLKNMTFTPDADGIDLTLTWADPAAGEGATVSQTIRLAAAGDTSAGLMSVADKRQLGDNTADIGQLQEWQQSLRYFALLADMNLARYTDTLRISGMWANALTAEVREGHIDLPAADDTHAGLLLPSEKTQIAANEAGMEALSQWRQKIQDIGGVVYSINYEQDYPEGGMLTVRYKSLTTGKESGSETTFIRTVGNDYPGLMTPDHVARIGNLERGMELKASKSDVETLDGVVQSIVEGLDDIGNVVTNIGSGRDEDGIDLVVTKKEATTGDSSTENFRIPLADDSFAGLMSPEEKSQLNNGIPSSLAAFLGEINRLWEIVEETASIGEIVTDVGCDAGTDSAILTVDTVNLMTKETDSHCAFLPVATETNAGVITAEKMAALNSLIDEGGSGGGDTSSNRRIAYHIEVEPIGDRLFISYDHELTAKGYVPYLFRYSVRHTHYAADELKVRGRGPKRKGWHRNYTQARLRIIDGKWIDFAYARNPGKTNPGWEFDDYGPVALFGKIRSEKVEATDKIMYKIPFGKKAYTIQEGGPSVRFKFGIAFAPPINGNRVNFHLNELVTNIAEFHVVAFLDDETLIPDTATPELRLAYSR